MYCFGDGWSTILLMAGVHGDEKAGVRMARRILRRLRAFPSSSLAQRIVVMPLCNPDGYKANTRRNVRGVDINRNFPTKDFDGGPEAPGGTAPASEPETAAIMDVVEMFQPDLIITLHGDMACVNYNGESAVPHAEKISATCGLEVRGDIGYPCPGSMGTYYGWERELPVITLELPPDGADMTLIEQAVLQVLGVGE